MWQAYEVLLHCVTDSSQISATIGVHVLRNRFQEHYRIVDAHAEAISLPRVGTLANCMFPSGQVNFSKPRARGTGEKVIIFPGRHLSVIAKSMKLENGKSGDAHMDETDAPAAFSFAIADPDVPDGYDQGRFHFLSLGTYVAFDGFTAWGFSGLFHHGGAPPMAPAGVQEEDIDIGGLRFLVVLYANKQILDGETLHNVSAIAGMSSDHSRSVNRIGPDLTTDK